MVQPGEGSRPGTAAVGRDRQRGRSQVWDGRLPWLMTQSRQGVWQRHKGDPSNPIAQTGSRADRLPVATWGIQQAPACMLTEPRGQEELERDEHRGGNRGGG